MVLLVVAVVWESAPPPWALAWLNGPREYNTWLQPFIFLPFFSRHGPGSGERVPVLLLACFVSARFVVFPPCPGPRSYRWHLAVTREATVSVVIYVS